MGTRRLLRSSAPLALSLPLRLVAHGIWAKSGRLLSEADIVAAGLAAAWGLAPCGATRGFPIWPTAGLCLCSRSLELLSCGVSRFSGWRVWPVCVSRAPAFRTPEFLEGLVAWVVVLQGPAVA